jgi:protocatechuate 3,4-dioxygenase beta subunit
MAYDDPDDLHDRGLAFDVQTLIGRRRALGLLAGVGALLVGCAVNEPSSSGGTTSTSTTSGSDATSNGGSSSSATSAAATCEDQIPEETAGPFPGDGSNGPDVLLESGIVRSDITQSIGSASGVAEGVPLAIELTLQDTANDCAPLAGAAVYLWHCTREGEYSMYGQGVENENFLRGVQESDADGKVRFVSIFPGAYSDRWPHAHFEVYSSLADATSSGPIKATSQLALPEEACHLAYATSGYEQSVSNLAQSSLESDNVFGDDGGVRQLATVTGDASAGFAASLVVPV